MNNTINPLPSSFRDPSGFLFVRNQTLYRAITPSYKEDYDFLMESGLYQALIEEELLISHREVEDVSQENSFYKIIQPEKIPFVSYPYEWTFSQFKDAALLTLAIQNKAIAYGMTLKDCSAYNIQFRNGKCIFIDTLSFERYRPGTPWVAYRQFCQHFLAPLVLMAYTDIRLNQLFKIYSDGVPLDLASSLLPVYTYAIGSLLMHIHMHARFQEKYSPEKIKRHNLFMSLNSFKGLIDNLEGTIKRLKGKKRSSPWARYYETIQCSTAALEHKKQIVADFIEKARPQTVWDLGANTGLFSMVAARHGALVTAFDSEASCIEALYQQVREKKQANLLPLVLDLTNPSQSLGWAHKERLSLIERGPADFVLALALIHHLRIVGTIPFKNIAAFFGEIAKILVIEFIPKSEEAVQRFLAVRADIFFDYSRESFENEFSVYFRIEETIPLRDSQRILYLMYRR